VITSNLQGVAHDELTFSPLIMKIYFLRRKRRIFPPEKRRKPPMQLSRTTKEVFFW